MSIVKDQSLMDIGSHCKECNKLDFLPFKCPNGCQGEIYCQDHRFLINEHELVCPLRKIRTSNVGAIQSSNRLGTNKFVSSASVFPDLKKIREEAMNKSNLENKQKLSNTLKNQAIGDNIEKTYSDALIKLRKYMKTKLGINNKNSSKVSSTSLGGERLGGLFGSSSGSSSSSAKKREVEKIIRLNKLKKEAKGDNKIPMSDRVYFSLEYIDYNVSHEIMQKSSKETSLFVSNKWPIGKVLDKASEELKINNLNNVSTEVKDRLTIFRDYRDNETVDLTNGSEEIDFKFISNNSRVLKEIINGDKLYLIRGA